MKNELISVIIPVYNTDNSIIRCINSLINQSYKEFEALFIDDGSTNGVDKVIKEYACSDSRIKYFYKDNSGVSSTRNYGIEKSKGNYICFLDSDDEYAENALERLIYLIKQKNCDFVRANFYYSKDDSKKSREGIKLEEQLIESGSKKELYIKKIIDGSISTFVWVLMIKKEFLTNIKFDENIDYMEDKVFYFELFSCAKKFYISNEPIYYYYYNDFLHNDVIYWIKYLKNVNAVFSSILEKSKKYFSNKYNDYIQNSAFLQINFIVFKIYQYNRLIKKYFELCDKRFLKKIKIYKKDNMYSKICIFFTNLKFYFGLKVMYFIKNIKE